MLPTRRSPGVIQTAAIWLPDIVIPGLWGRADRISRKHSSVHALNHTSFGCHNTSSTISFVAAWSMAQNARSHSSAMINLTRSNQTAKFERRWVEDLSVVLAATSYSSRHGIKSRVPHIPIVPPKPFMELRNVSAGISTQKSYS